jgi:FkbM family methyltransferase
MQLEKNKVFVQIGTFDGADEFNGLVKFSFPSKVVLVEPNIALRATILENYKGIDNVSIEHVVITEVNKGVVPLVFPDRRPNDAFYNACFSILPLDDWGNKFKQLNVQSMTFAELCEKHDITDIHYLQIDTEGYDYEIIKSIDFKKIKIDILKYEIWNFDESNFKRYGEKAKLYGTNGMRDVANLLQSLNYELTEEKLDIIAVKKYE